MRRSGQSLFVPRAGFQTIGESEWRECYILRGRGLYVRK